MSERSLGITRRLLAAAIVAAPAAAQVTSRVPPQEAPAAAPPSTPPNQKLEKAYDDIRATSKRLSAIELPMNVEPAFTFRP